MYCPIQESRECWIDCPWACVTASGYCCAIALIAMDKHNDVGINFEKLPGYLWPTEDDIEE